MHTKSLLKRILSLVLSFVLMLTMSMALANTVFAAEVTLSDNTVGGLQSAIDDAGTALTIIDITGDINFGGNIIDIPINANITIRSDGSAAHTLTQTSERHFGVKGSLTIENIILDGSTGGTASGGGVDVTFEGISHGKFTMNSRAVIQNCYSKNAGGGVAVTYGTFTMKDGAVIQNCTADSGGGMFINSGVITINNASVKGSKATCGGGIYLTGSGTSFVMYDGIIGGSAAGDGNTANYGGGIFAVGTNNKIYI